MSNGEEVDGVISAAILSRYLENKAEISYIFFGFSDLKACLKNLIFEKSSGLREDKELYVLGLGLGKELSVGVLIELACCFKEITWVDYHPETIQNSKRKYLPNAEFLLPEEKQEICASVLIFRNYMTKDFVSGRLSRIAQISDYLDGFDRFSGEALYAGKLQKVIDNLNRECLKDLCLPVLVEDLKKHSNVFGGSCVNSKIYSKMTAKSSFKGGVLCPLE
jgi:hypothetical protein